jgi:hypothetical protein
MRVDQRQRRLGPTQFPDRHAADSHQGDREVQQGRDPQRQQDGKWQVLFRLAYFLCHVDHVLEAGEGEKCQEGAEEHPIPDTAASEGRRRVERSARPVEQRRRGDRNDQQQTGNFDNRDQGGSRHRLGNAPSREPSQHHDADQQRGQFRHVDEYLQITGKTAQDRSRAHHPDHHDQAAHQAGQRPVAGPRLDVSRRAGADRITRRQFGIGQSGQSGQQGGQYEGQGHVHPGVQRDLADQHIDAGAQDVAQAVEGGKGQRQRALECRLLTGSGWAQAGHGCIIAAAATAQAICGGGRGLRRAFVSHQHSRGEYRDLCRDRKLHPLQIHRLR